MQQKTKKFYTLIGKDIADIVGNSSKKVYAGIKYAIGKLAFNLGSSALGALPLEVRMKMLESKSPIMNKLDDLVDKYHEDPRENREFYDMTHLEKYMHQVQATTTWHSNCLGLVLQRHI